MNSIEIKPDTRPMADIRRHCRGLTPLDARIEPWMRRVCQSDEMASRVEEHGSPLNVLSTGPFLRNIEELRGVARKHGIDLGVFFARKANKCLSFIDAAKSVDCGIDTASLPELQQVLQRDVSPSRVICTAAVKSAELLRTCIVNEVVIAIDNLDELQAVYRLTHDLQRTPLIALRISGFEHDGQRLHSRFGFDIRDVMAMLQDGGIVDCPSSPQIAGIHFHLDGYCHRQRITAIRASLELIDELRQAGHQPGFLDMGGGFPMCYLKSESQWQTFWDRHRQALLGRGPALTYRNHGLGLLAVDGRIAGRARSYPFFQTLVQAAWLDEILGADSGEAETDTVAAALDRRNLELRCEPGRSVLDGCGMTIARVEYRKQHPDGYWLIGLAMNHTQCRTSSDDFLVDPLVIPGDRRELPDRHPQPPLEGFLVGAYCTESELLCQRRLVFPQGIARGDLVVFPNTAGYLMHFLESRSHQFPLAANLFVDAKLRCAVDR